MHIAIQKQQQKGEWESGPSTTLHNSMTPSSSNVPQMRHVHPSHWGPYPSTPGDGVAYKGPSRVTP